VRDIHGSAASPFRNTALQLTRASASDVELTLTEGFLPG
jgi:hypothetical protein